MNLKRASIASLAFLLCLGSLFAQDQPEIAYRILTSYIEKKEGGRGGDSRAGGAIVAGLGGLLIAGAATTWFAGDAIAQSAGLATGMDPDTKAGLSIGLGVGGLVLSGVGAGIIFSKPHDYRLEYGEVFKEDDRLVREALSVAVLRDMSVKAQKARVTKAISNLLVPVLTAAIRAGVNLSTGKEWSDGVVSSISWSAWSVATAISGLFGSTEEERLYAKYLAGRDALYGERGSNY